MSGLTSAILILALAGALTPKPASATTYLYTFSFTEQDVLTQIGAFNGTQAATLPRYGIYSLFLSAPAGYTISSESISQQPTDPWAASTYTYNGATDPSDMAACNPCVSFDKVSQSTVQVITQSPAAFAGKSYTGTASAPVFFGGVSETFNAAAVPLTTRFTILLSAASITNPVTFSGFASSATADSSSSFGLGKTDTGLQFNLSLTGASPEPGTWGLLLGGVGLMLVGSWKRKKTPK
jgi:hypothetical protein